MPVDERATVCVQRAAQTEQAVLSSRRANTFRPRYDDEPIAGDAVGLEDRGGQSLSGK
jgi:hypothetical protein